MNNVLQYAPILNPDLVPIADQPADWLFANSGSLRLAHPVYAMLLGSHQITINHRDDGPIAFICDPLLYMPDATGAPIPGSGLMPGSGPIYDALMLLVEKWHGRGWFMGVPYDAHPIYNRQANPAALTRIRLTDKLMSSHRLTPAQRSYALTFLKRKIDSQEPLTVAEAQQFLGEAVTSEFDIFFEHCAVGIEKFIPAFDDLWKAQRRQVEMQREQGVVAPEVNIVPMPKRDLRGDVPPNYRGQGSNYMTRILQELRNDVPQGPNNPLMQLSLSGTAIQYTVTQMAEFGVTMNYHVHLNMAAIFSIPGLLSKYECVYRLRSLYPKRVTAGYGWPKFAGTAPVGYNQLAEAVRELDKDERAQSYAAYLPDQLPDGEPVISDWEGAIQ